MTRPVNSPRIVNIAIYEDSAQPPTKAFQGVPWFPGMTILHAMIIAQDMNFGSFQFQVEFNSLHGAFVNKVDTIEDKGSFYWLVQQNQLARELPARERRGR